MPYAFRLTSPAMHVYIPVHTNSAVSEQLPLCPSLGIDHLPGDLLIIL